MTAYTYGYNLNGIMSFKSSNLVSRSQTNVNSITDVAEDLDALAADSFPKRSDNSSIYKLVPGLPICPNFRHSVTVHLLRGGGGGGGSGRIEPLRQFLDHCTQKRNNKRKEGKPIYH